MAEIKTRVGTPKYRDGWDAIWGASPEVKPRELTSPLSRAVMTPRFNAWGDFIGLDITRTMSMEEFREKYPTEIIPDAKCNCWNHPNQVCDICQASQGRKGLPDATGTP